MRRYGFTFIEILVVITILAIVSTISLASLFRTGSGQELRVAVEGFSSHIRQYESDIGQKNILDFSLFITPGIAYTYELNHKKENISFRLIQPISGDFQVLFSLLPGNIGQVNMFYGNKFEKTFFNQTGNTSTGTFTPGKTMSLELSVQGKEKNTIGVGYYALSDIQNDAKNLILKTIWSNPDKTGTSYTGIIIKDRNGQIQLQDFAGNTLASTTLVFELGGKEDSLTLP